MRAFNYDFGIEEEFFLTSASTGLLIDRPPADLLRIAKRKLGDAESALRVVLQWLSEQTLPTTCRKW